MVLSAVVLLLAVVVIGVGSLTELTQTVRARRKPAVAQPGAVEQAVLDELDPRPFLMWFGIAALAVLAPGLLHDSALSGSELGLAVVVLGLAGERGQYLTRSARTDRARAAWSAAAAALTVLGGLVVGAS